MATKTILSLDGGGIRGVIPARILAAIEKQTGKPVCELFDYVAGTSTGGILALCLTKPDAKGKPSFTADQILQMYKDHGSTIFHASFWHQVKSLWSVTGPKYPADGIEAVLKQYLGDVLLDKSLSRVLIPAFSIDHRAPRFFKSWNVNGNPVEVIPMWQVARATSAAPTYFPPFRLLTGAMPCTLVDGGVVSNTPAMCIFADAIQSEPPGTKFKVLSIGTGTGNGTIDPVKAAGWGEIQWIQPIIDILMDACADTTDYQLLNLLGQLEHDYLRLQIPMTGEGPAMDDVTIIPDMIAAADKLLADKAKEIDEFFAS